MKKLKLECLALAAGLSVMACGDGDSLPTPPAGGGTTAPTAGGTTTPLPDAGAPVAAPTAPSRFLAGTRTFTPDGSQTFSYFQVVGSVDAGNELDTKKSIELTGSVKLFTLSDGSWLALGEAEAPVLTRYTVDAAGALQKRESLTLQPSGVTSFFGDVLYEATPNTVYYPDVDGHQLVVIDPVAMAVRGTIPLPATERAGYTAYYSEGYVKRDGKVLFSVGWFDWTADKIIPETGLVVIDTRTNTVERVDVDARCGGIDTPLTLANGDAYFVSNTMAASAFDLKRYEKNPCALRVRAGADKFDPDYALDLRTVVGGALAGDPIPAGGDALYLRVLDKSLATTTAQTASFELANQPAWRWVRWDLGTNTSTPLALPPAPSNTEWFQIGERVFAAEVNADYTRSVLLELNAPGGPKPALASPGYLHSLVGLR
ncbi:MAG: hypothetical protein ABW252_14815 [Polyangiales bacterium]